MKATKDSLVLYKRSPALVLDADEKLNILLPGGETKSVREKDVVALHPGPVPDFPDLKKDSPTGQPEIAWELLRGEHPSPRPSLKELAELIYREYSPSSSWLTFKLLNRSPWFSGGPDSIEVSSEETVSNWIELEKRRADAKQRWKEFLERFDSGDIQPDADEIHLRDLEMCALGRVKGSRVLKALGRVQNPENAHRLLVSKKIKTPLWNPHPLRLNVPLDPPPHIPVEFAKGEKRLDLRGIEAFAIDDEGNMDPDDALGWDGGKFWVHVADVAGLIPVCSSADKSAGERAGSLYLPERKVPMLPPEMTAKLGLGLHPTSPALSYAFETDAEGRILDFSIHLSTIRVTRLSYREADERLGEEPFATMKRICAAFRGRREEAGAITINMPEVKLYLDEEGIIQVMPLRDYESRNLVAEAMLMAGSYAAAWCHERGIPIPYAVQNTPDESPDKLVSGDSGHPYLTQFNLRRGMKRSRITLERAPHAGLGLESYTRVTSPLRRYPDLISSQQIRAAILGQRARDAESVQHAIGAVESRIETLILAERKSNIFWKLQWLALRTDYTCEAYLVDRRERQGYVIIPELAYETRVALKKEIKLGSCVSLELKKVDVFELSTVFSILEVLE